MREDWSWTVGTVYEDGKFRNDYNWSDESINVAGISGSIWATPVMAVHKKDGHEVIVECWVRNEEEAAPSEIREAKAFAAATGGMDFKL